MTSEATLVSDLVKKRSWIGEKVTEVVSMSRRLLAVFRLTEHSSMVGGVRRSGVREVSGAGGSTRARGDTATGGGGRRRRTAPMFRTTRSRSTALTSSFGSSGLGPLHFTSGVGLGPAMFGIFLTLEIALANMRVITALTMK